MTNTQKFIQEVEERLAKATPGPWDIEEAYWCWDGERKERIEDNATIAIRIGAIKSCDGCAIATEPDAILVSHSPIDLAKAIAALKEAHLTLTEQLKHVCDGGGDKPCSQMWFQDVAQESLDEIEKILGDQ